MPFWCYMHMLLGKKEATWPPDGPQSNMLIKSLGSWRQSIWPLRFQSPVVKDTKKRAQKCHEGTKQTQLLDSLLMSQAMEKKKKQKRTLNTPVSPWEISDTYSGLQMSAILMNTPKIKFLGIRFLRIAGKSQHSLAGVVLQNRQETALLIPEQGVIWAILNETCCFWVNTSS